MIHSTTDFEDTREATGVDAGDDGSDDAERGADDAEQASDDDPPGTGSSGERSAGTGGTEESRRAVLGYALLFSLPVGVGVAVMLLQVTRGRPTDALVFGPSLALAAAVFLLLLAVGAGGSPEP
jgi:hypothetical protein